MKVAFCLFFTLAFFFLYSDCVTEAMEEKGRKNDIFFQQLTSANFQQLTSNSCFLQIQCSNQEQEACTLELQPHCGSDGNTYDNRCLFCNAVVRSRGSLKLKHYGSCEKIRKPLY